MAARAIRPSTADMNRFLAVGLGSYAAEYRRPRAVELLSPVYDRILGNRF